MLPQKQNWYDLIGQRTVDKLNARGFSACYCPTRGRALAQLLSWIPAGEVVAWGGSETVRELGALDALRRMGQPMIDAAAEPDPRIREQKRRESLLCDVYLSGCNAISADGQLVNLDGVGNRVGAIVYGPRNVILAAGVNKICRDLDEAVSRVRTEAAPINAQKFPERGLPCLKTGVCADCARPDSICAQLVITRFCRPAGRIKVIIVGEEMGF